MAESLTETRTKKHRKRSLILISIWLFVSITGLILLLLGTTPDRVGPTGITLFFLLIFASIMALGMLLRHFLAKTGGSASQLSVILVSAAITSALAIGTIQLQIGDILLLALFVVTFSVYWSRLR